VYAFISLKNENIIRMTSVEETLWEVINNMVPLFQDDLDTFLLKEGYLTDEDRNKWNNAVRLIKDAYRKSFSSVTAALEDVRRAQEIIQGITPKKPLPPEMKTRLDEIISYLSSMFVQETKQPA